MKNIAKAQGEFTYLTVERALEKRVRNNEVRNRYARYRPTWKQIAAILDRAEWAEVVRPGSHNRPAVYRYREAEESRNMVHHVSSEDTPDIVRHVPYGGLENEPENKQDDQ